MSKKITIELSQETYNSLKSQIEKKGGKLKKITKKKLQIKNKWTGDVICESERTTYKDALEEAIDKGVCLKDVDLEGVNLKGANLRYVDLEGANLAGANLKDVRLRGANLAGANLEGVRLKDVDLVDANLEGVCLKDVDLADVDLKGVCLKGVDLEDVNLADADFYHTKFHGKGGATKIKKSQINDFLTALGVVVEEQLTK